MKGPVVDDSMANMRKLYRRLFPENADDEDALMKPRDGGVGGLSYYYEFIVGQREPSPKVHGRSLLRASGRMLIGCG